MPALHDLFLYSPTGEYLDSLNDYESIECVLAEMQIGTLTITVPANRYDPRLFQRDGRVAFHRAPDSELSLASSMRLVGNTAWLIARRTRIVDRDYRESIRLLCVHPNALLARRVVAYDEESAEAKKTGAADNLIKAVVRENFTAATDTDRNWSSAFFSVEADTSAAPSVDKEFSYRTVLQVCQEIAAAAAAAGTYTGFEVYSQIDNGPFVLRTYTAQRGTDRSTLSGKPLVFGISYASFEDTELDENWSEMASFVYAGGSGKKNERVVQPVSDTALIAETPYGRIEWFQNVAQTTDTAVLDSEGARALRERRPRRLFTGAVRETTYATFGEEYDWGDRVVGESRSGGLWQSDFQQLDCRVDPVRIAVVRTENTKTGEITKTETLDVRLRSES